HKSLEFLNGGLEAFDSVQAAAFVKAHFVSQNAGWVGGQKAGKGIGGGLVLASAVSVHGTIKDGLFLWVGGMRALLAGSWAIGLALAAGLPAQFFYLAAQRHHFGAQGINLISQLQASLGVLLVHLTNLLPQLQNGASGLVIGKGLGRQAGEQGGRSEQGNGRETKRLFISVHSEVR